MIPKCLAAQSQPPTRGPELLSGEDLIRLSGQVKIAIRIKMLAERIRNLSPVKGSSRPVRVDGPGRVTLRQTAEAAEMGHSAEDQRVQQQLRMA